MGTKKVGGALLVVGLVAMAVGATRDQSPWSAIGTLAVWAGLASLMSGSFLARSAGSFLATCLILWGVGVVLQPAGLPASTRPPAQVQPVLELQGWQWREEHGFAIVEGKVKNISAGNLEAVAASASFATKAGAHITAKEALVDFNPILPGQTSPFRVMAHWNPEMSKVDLTFKRLLGGTLPWRQKEPAVAKKK